MSYLCVGVLFLLCVNFIIGFLNHPYQKSIAPNSLNQLKMSYLGRMIERKKKEVDSLLRKHSTPDDPLFLRLTYINDKNNYLLTKAIQKYKYTDASNGTSDKFDDYYEGNHKMTLLFDIKKTSPTIPNQRNIVEYSSASKFCELLTLAGSDGFLINTDEVEYSGSLDDLKSCASVVKKIKPDNPPVIIHKDIIIHPIQVIFII